MAKTDDWTTAELIPVWRFYIPAEQLTESEMGVVAVDDILCREGDNRTIGLLLCKGKDRIKAEYALRDIQKPIGVSDYELGQALPKDFRDNLPTIEEIERELEIK